MPPLKRRHFLQGSAGALALGSLGCSGSRDIASARFAHGVASGDPQADRCIIWTRVTPEPGDVAARNISWRVTRDPGLRDIVNDGVATTNAGRDFTLKLDVTGLPADSTLYFGFFDGDEASPVGRLRTLPVGAVEQLRLAVLTCGDYSRGFFNAYARVAERDDLHAVLHLGDYIYENGNTDRVRPHDPPHKCVTLADYRRRYSQYREDADLQALHAAHAMIWVWDDHEFANNTWRDGADNHDPETDGDFAARDAAALQAALEWMPIRSPDPAEPLRIYRDFAFGDLVDLSMLDTRRIGREQQLSENTIVGDNLPAFTQTGGFADPGRQLLGAEQEAWLFDRLRNSTARWRLIGQQVMLAQLKVAGLPDGLGGGVYGNPDQWDGYKAARDRLFAALDEGNIGNVVVLAGDFHVAFASDVAQDPSNPAAYNPLTGAGAQAVEFVTPSATSAGDRRSLLDPDLLTDPGDLLEELVVGNPLVFQAPNPHIKFTDGGNGYTLLEITPDAVRAEYWAVSQVGAPDAGQERIAQFRVDDGVAALRWES